MVFKTLKNWGDQAHEKVLFCSHPETGLKAIIAIHSTHLGPALGGCRMYPYPTEAQALEDVLKLSSAMSYKSAMAGLELGGGKSVIIADPEKDKTPDLFRAFGVHIESLKGSYVVAKDMGITMEDLQYMGEQSSYVIGRPVPQGGVGDPSYSTAKGVFYGIQQACQIKLKKTNLKGVRIVVQGLGAVGSHLVKFLSEEQAELFVCDIREATVQKLQSQIPNLKAISPEELFKTPCEVFAPCAMGGVINEPSLEQLNCLVVAGGANNQLSEPHFGKKLKDKGILYIPDFIINSGGLIYVSSFLSPKKSKDWIEKKLKNISKTIKEICDISSSEGLDPAQIALDLAKKKIKKKSFTKAFQVEKSS